jgi:arylsulfotransferase ASST
MAVPWKSRVLRCYRKQPWFAAQPSRFVLAWHLAGLIPILALGIILAGAEPGAGQGKPTPTSPKFGVVVREPKAWEGYTLIASTNSTSTHLVDMAGRVVRTWQSDCLPGLSAYLLENGNLLRTGQIKNPPFFGGGTGGRIQEFTWDGELVWDYTFYSAMQLPNHDVCKLPNGNVLMIVWEKKTVAEAAAVGRRPETVKGYLLADCILEVQPTGKTSGKIVWEWRPWDHLVQDYDAKKARHDDVGAHPERIDINFGENTIAAVVAQPKELEKLRSIGYVGAGRRAQPQTDWLHINSVAYNAELDQIMLSVFEFNEIWIIDHSTTTAQAAGHDGGRYGKGGDLLYRWGNPRAYRAGTLKDQKLFGQHNAHWISKELPGAGHVLVFNNGLKRPAGAYSSVDELVLPVDARGQYARTKDKAFGPEQRTWTYSTRKKTDFFAPFISGAQRLENGNTLICSGTNGIVFEVTKDEEVVWKFVNPLPGSAGPGSFGEVLAPFHQDALKMSAPQKKQLSSYQKEVSANLQKILTDEQNQRLAKARPGIAADGIGLLPPPGQILSRLNQSRLKLTEAQKQQLKRLQSDTDQRLGTILTEEQQKQFKGMQASGLGPPGGFGPPGGLRPGGPVGFPGFGPPGGSGLFRANRYAASYPGLAGRDLMPGKTLEELQKTTR